MRLIDVDDIADIALGSALLGAGGGGDPYMGSLETTAALRECGPVCLLDADEVPDDWTVASIGSVGAPTVVLEKGVNGGEYARALDLLERRLGRKIDAFVLAEAGGLNSLVPIAAAARVGIPVVNVDGMGRAFPGLQQDTYCMAGVPTTPMAFVDEKGNRALIETIDNDWTEAIGRAVTTACGGALINLGASMSGAQMKACAVRDTVDLAQRLGRIIRTAKDARGCTPREFFLRESGAHLFLQAKIADVLRETRDGFNFGRAVLEGTGEDRGRQGAVVFQNENLYAEVDGRVALSVPDLVCLVEADTFAPVTTEALRYGKRVLLVGLPCDAAWRTPEGLALGGPAFFGFDIPYIPVETSHASFKGEKTCER
ncbi:DUF917 domain-containing protein [Arabiibacter massiliensis]|uniref:DUF917 domain-containing protein n=1 Tax=Arabiibacter massiliensis TaxID=1870985 RepID=UPI0009BA3134|nr:DUF917 domain-containing protein [Arabiibacter massiliensis]